MNSYKIGVGDKRILTIRRQIGLELKDEIGIYFHIKHFFGLKMDVKNRCIISALIYFSLQLLYWYIVKKLLAKFGQVFSVEISSLAKFNRKIPNQNLKFGTKIVKIL